MIPNFLKQYIVENTSSDSKTFSAIDTPWLIEPIKKDLIEWKSHKEWFVKKLNCKTSYLFIAEKDQAKIGQVRFDCVNLVAKIDYSISSDYRGNGYGKAIVLKGIEKLIGESNKIKKFEAIVRVENIASRKIFLG